MTAVWAASIGLVVLAMMRIPIYSAAEMAAVDAKWRPQIAAAERASGDAPEGSTRRVLELRARHWLARFGVWATELLYAWIGASYVWLALGRIGQAPAPW